MEYRLNKSALLEHLSQWDAFLKRKVHFIACGGTAMTLLGVKASTRDIDFMVPHVNEYEYLIKTIQDLGYQSKSGWGWSREGDLYVFDLFRGKHIHTTELSEDPLKKDRHTFVKELAHIYLGILNDYDLIVSKLFRGAQVDFEDCLALFEAHQETIHFEKLKDHFHELLSYHSVREDRVRQHWDTFERRAKGMR
jgi:hypothetical protein